MLFEHRVVNFQCEQIFAIILVLSLIVYSQFSAAILNIGCQWKVHLFKSTSLYCKASFLVGYLKLLNGGVVDYLDLFFLYRLFCINSASVTTDDDVVGCIFLPSLVLSGTLFAINFFQLSLFLSQRHHLRKFLAGNPEYHVLFIVVIADFEFCVNTMIILRKSAIKSSFSQICQTFFQACTINQFRFSL